MAREVQLGGAFVSIAKTKSRHCKPAFVFIRSVRAAAARQCFSTARAVSLVLSRLLQPVQDG